MGESREKALTPPGLVQLQLLSAVARRGVGPKTSRCLNVTLLPLTVKDTLLRLPEWDGC